jgi:RNA polymerase sigma factor (TIGR02999 family)
MSPVILEPMSEVSHLLDAIGQGDPHAADQLMPLVYAELRRLAAQKLRHEAPGQTLQPTALVHEAYLRLLGKGPEPAWDNRGHFFAAAAEAMRRILVESARRKKRHKHGGGWRRVELQDRDCVVWDTPDEMLALDEALTNLAREDPAVAGVVKLHFYAGLSMDEVAQALGQSRATVYRHWTYGRAWLRAALQRDESAR